MSGEDGIDMTNSERIQHERCGAQVWLQFFNTCHALHLMPFFHQWVTVALLARTAPEINAHIGTSF